jgi:hypothetical protein
MVFNVPIALRAAKPDHSPIIAGSKEALMTKRVFLAWLLGGSQSPIWFCRWAKRGSKRFPMSRR